MIVAVIGSDGYIGRHLCALLEQEKVQVLRFDAGVYGQKLHYTTVRTHHMAEVVEELKRCKPDVIVYLAAYAHDPEGRIPAHYMEDNNAIKPATLARWAADHLIPFIAASSLSVFSLLGEYPKSKRSMERALLTLPMSCRFVDVVRFGTLFGIDHDADSLEVWRSHLLLNSMVYTGITEGKIRISYPGLRRPVTSLHQAAQFLRTLVFYNGPRGRIMNIYNTCGSLQNYAETVKACLLEMAHKADIEVANAGIDLRDYGWGDYAPVSITSDLYHTIRWVEKYRETIASQRTQFPANLYNYLGLSHSGPK